MKVTWASDPSRDHKDFTEFTGEAETVPKLRGSSSDIVQFLGGQVLGALSARSGEVGICPMSKFDDRSVYELL